MYHKTDIHSHELTHVIKDILIVKHGFLLCFKTVIQEDDDIHVIFICLFITDCGKKDLLFEH